MTRASPPALVLIFFAVLAAGCGFSKPSQIKSEAEHSASAAEFRRDFQNLNCDNSGRLNSARDLLKRHGHDFDVEEYKRSTNLIFELKGHDPEVVVIGAHYDKTDAGCGAIDNWSGVVLMAWVLTDLKETKNDKSYKFVAFGAEEKGLWGSQEMVDGFSSEERINLCAMVNLDSFGFEKAWAMESISDRSLLMLASDVERERGGSFSIRNYPGATSDSVSFRRIGTPSITFSGVGGNWRDYLHKAEDQPVYIDFEKLHDNYLFLREFLLKLDSISCDSLRK